MHSFAIPNVASELSSMKDTLFSLVDVHNQGFELTAGPSSEEHVVPDCGKVGVRRLICFQLRETGRTDFKPLLPACPAKDTDLYNLFPSPCLLSIKMFLSLGVLYVSANLTSLLQILSS